MNTLVKHILSASAFVFAIGAAFANITAPETVYKQVKGTTGCLVTALEIRQICTTLGMTQCSIVTTSGLNYFVFKDGSCQTPFHKR